MLFARHVAAEAHGQQCDRLVVADVDPLQERVELPRSMAEIDASFTASAAVDSALFGVTDLLPVRTRRRQR
jgi:hypothetical protein